MKKILSLLISIALMLTLCSCEPVEEIGRTPIDCRYTAAYTEVVTDYKHEYSWWKGDFVLVPDTHTKLHPEKYEILYSITYDDGSSREVWKEVDRSTYVSFKGE